MSLRNTWIYAASPEGKLALTCVQWLPKPATILFPDKRRALRASWSPEERMAQELSGFSAVSITKSVSVVPRRTTDDPSTRFRPRRTNAFPLLGGEGQGEGELPNSAQPQT